MYHMMTESTRPYLTAAGAAKELGYSQGSAVTVLCNAGRVPGAYKAGRIWLVPAAWVEERKKADADAGIVPGKRPMGRPVTTGAGLNRKRIPQAYKPTGRPKGRPRKQPDVPTA